MHQHSILILEIVTRTLFIYEYVLPQDDDFAAAKVDEIIDTATDMTIEMGATMRMEDKEEQKAARAKLIADDGKMTKYFKALDKILKDNGSTGFFVGKTMTIADIAMWRLLGWFKGGILDGLPTDLIDKYPLLSKFWIDMDANPDIRAYMEAKYPPEEVDNPRWIGEAMSRENMCFTISLPNGCKTIVYARQN